ncbi:hypothetical protein Tco_1261790 [Tanacetum coccineum]
MLNPSLDTGINSIFNLNTESTFLVDVLVTTIAKTPLSSATTLRPPIIPLITHLQQTPVPTPTTVPSSSLQDLPNLAVSSILGILDANLANKMHEAVKTVVQLQSDRLRDESQAENEDVINKLDDNIKKIIKDQVKEQTSYVVVANLSELELKKILIDKMENDEDKDEEPYAGSNRGSKRRRAGKEPESTSGPKEKTSKTIGKSTKGSKSYHESADKSVQVEVPINTAKDLEEPAHQEFVTGDTKDKPNEETSQLPDWFQKLAKPPTPNHDCNKTLPAVYGPVQPWVSTLSQKEDTRESFNEPIDTPLDFSAFIMNRLKVDTLTPELLAGSTFELMKGSCKSKQYPHDLRKPLPLIPNSRGRQVIPFDHFINNNLAYLSGGVSSQIYTTSVMKTKAADYRHTKWIEYLVPNRMWSQVPESTRDVYSKGRIIAVIKLQIVKWHNYKHLDWITILRDDDKLYKFKEGDFNRLHIQDIKDMLLLLNKDKKNKLMRIDELYKFSDGTLNDVRIALNDRLKGIQMKYLS